MKRLTSALLVTVLTSGLIVTPVFATPSVDELEQSKEATQSEVSSLQEELTSLISKIGELEEKLVKTGQDITKAEEDLEVAQEKEKQQYADMKLRIKFMYEEGEASAIETILSSKDFSDLLNKAEYVQNVHSYDREMLEEYVQTKQQVANLKSTLETEMETLETTQVEFEDEKESLDATIADKQSEIANMDSMIQEAVAQAAEEQARREQEAQAAAEQEEAANNTQTAQNNNSNTTNSNSNTNSNNPSYEGQGNTAVAQTIVQAAYSQLGVPYRWGGSTPGVGLDCSGLVQYCHAVAGISLPHYSESQYAGGKKVSNPQPGDICWKPGHVAIYIGNGKMIEAQQTGTNIMISNVRAVAYARYW